MDELTPQNISKEGLTVLPPLSTPGNVAVEQNVDIVFLHGFGGDPRGTWENKVSKFYWPAQLRKDIPEARIMVYGYDTAFKIALSQNRTTIKAIAEIFVSRLVDYRQEALRDRPLILVAHSLGGLVVKRALVEIFSSRFSELDTQYRQDRNAIYESIAGLVFLGTPHAGSTVTGMKRLAILKAIFSFVKVPPNIMDALEANSQELKELSDRFAQTTLSTESDVEIWTYYELFDTQLVGQEVVPLAMAEMHCKKEHLEGVSANHTQMVKFHDATDGTYQTIMRRLQRMGEEFQVYERCTTYRVRQIPFDFNEKNLRVWLAKNAKGFGPEENIQILSLTNSTSNDHTKTATLQFKITPHMFRKRETDWKLLKDDTGLSHNVIIDVHFRGLTPLNDVDPKDHILDCIAIAGFATHPFGSWEQHDCQSTFMWLRDKLTRDLDKRVRVMLYGHHTHIAESSSLRCLQDIGRSLSSAIELLAQASDTPRHMVFIAHSLGGIVLKSALIGLANAGHPEENKIDKVEEIFLFGVPNDPSRPIPLPQLLPMVYEKLHGEGIPEPVRELPSNLNKIDADFIKVTECHPIRLISFYETVESRTANIDFGSGHWDRDGPPQCLVDYESAVQPSDPMDVFPVFQDHLSLLKLTEDDDNYHAIVNYLLEVSKRLLSKTGSPKADELLQSSQGSGWLLWARFKNTLIEKVKGSGSEINPGKPTSPRLIPAAMDLAQKIDIYVENQEVARKNKKIMSPNMREGHQEENGNLNFLLKSLHKEDTSHRFDQIEKAFPSTFDWIWNNTSLGFDNWLRNGKGLYMISGKLGCGKSTLMKYICTSHQTWQALDWRYNNSKRKQISAKGFFLNGGSFNQRSLDGLLHSLLEQIVLANHTLGDIISTVYYNWIASQGGHWCWTDLIKAFTALMEQKDVDVDILLILDALDEYEGPPEDVANFLRMISSCPDSASTQIRCCFSTRPCEQFDYLLQELDYNMYFNMDEHTEQDLEIYVRKRLAKSDKTASLENEDPLGTSDWISKVAKKAESMFLYLKLVIDKVLDDFQLWIGSQALPPDSGVKLRKLEDLVETDAFPTNLGEFYQQIIGKIPKEYRPETYIMLELVLRFKEPINLLRFQSMVECALANTLAESVAVVATPGKPDLEIALIWMKSRAGGLIEPDIQNNYSPQFIHKSVKDFVKKSQFASRVLGRNLLLHGQNGYSFLARYGLSLLVSSWDSKDTSLTQPKWSKYLSYAHLAEITTKISQKHLFDQVDDDDVFGWVAARERFHYYDSMLSYAITADLRIFVAEKLEELGRSGRISNKSLLHCAVEAITLNANHSPSKDIEVKIPASFDLSRMFQDLIHLGCDVSSISKGKTPFQLLFSNCFEGFGDGTGSRVTSSMIKVAQILLENRKDENDPGQDANQSIEISVKWWQKRYNQVAKQTVICTPLHAASSLEMIKLLLAHKADVNALDSNQNTPLDIYLGAEDDLGAIGEDKHPIGAYDAACLLVSRGGRINQAKSATLDTFSRVFSSELKQGLPDRLVCKQLRKPPKIKHGLLGGFGRRHSS